jgi:xylulose-5-phosphate/fructose-6-phosphate phosphoketolase
MVTSHAPHARLPTEETPMTTLSPDLLRRMHAWWRAANYLSVGQIYLLDNPLLRSTAQPRRRQAAPARALGHHPGLNFLYAHLNRLIADHGQSTIYLTGPGHGGPGLVANAYLDGTYTEYYPDITPGRRGLRRLFRQFSFPGGIPSTWRRRPQAPSTRAASWAMRCPTPTVRHSTTPT